MISQKEIQQISKLEVFLNSNCSFLCRYLGKINYALFFKRK